ncbi:response regulator [Devosia sediminis]|uniref:Response regulator n=1 Tax=Devosia sediminis TaxID=2798801 RepID=A0A934IV20_9HYPH|nr:response regulator [Devosia sediminis]MBJ3783298.1 response regulator [Devosia sediminis]
MDTSRHAAPQSFLVVDDEAFVRADLAELIRDLGHEAWEAASTAEALAMLNQSAHAFTGLVTDVNMPGSRNGIVLAHHVRFVWPHIRVIVVSAGRKPLAGALPADTPFFAKPWDPERLASALSATH